jgi:aspartokinase-like uncharacterized kinase
VIVAKVGGSLFDLPQLGDALARWAAEQPAPVLFVPGGGPFADVIRALDRVHDLGEDASHWLAVRTLSVTARLLVHLLSDAELLDNPTWGELEQKRWDDPDRVYVLDEFEFFCRHDSVPHTWSVTSDSLALSAAMHMNADRLVLLKSRDIGDVTWDQAAARGWVDGHFPHLVKQAEFPVEAVNFRTWVEGQELTTEAQRHREGM